MKEVGKARTVWLRILGYFLMGMLLLTILSRAADSIMLPAVKTARPLPGALTHTVVLNGTVEAKELYPVIATDDLIVMRVHGRAGQSVKAGDALLSYDMEMLQTELKTKKTALERVTLEGKRQATGNESAQDAETERRILRLDTDVAQAEVDRINALIANGGIVTAPVDGTIIEVMIKPGEVASGVVFRIAPASSGMIARAPVSNDQWPHLRSGMQANAQRQGEALGKGVIATISELVPSASGYEAVFELSDSAWSVGQSLTLTLTQTTDTYDMKVPLSAIAESNGNKGVYRVRTRDSVLGETEYAEFVPVKVIETDAQSAAIEATLSDKTDLTGKKELEGAKLTILDSEGKVVETWTSTTEPHYIEMLPIGKYTLREETAPSGYLVAEDVEFEIKDTAEIQTVTMKDAEENPEQPGTPMPDTPKTGDLNNPLLWGGVGLVALLGLMTAVLMRKNRRKF